jgi:Fe-S cluster biosynthesis and repair protein YggX
MADFAPLQGNPVLNALNDINEANLIAYKTKYAPQQYQTDLNLKNAEINQYPYKNALLSAQTDLTNQNAKFVPMDNLIRAQAALQSQSRFGGAYNLSRMLQSMSKPAADTWIQQHQTEYNQMLSDLGNKDTPNYLSPQMMSQFFGDLMKQGATQVPPNGQPQGTSPLPMSPQQQASVQNKIGTNALTVSPQEIAAMQMPAKLRFSPSTPEQVQAVQLANQMAANKALTTTATQRQVEGAKQIEEFVSNPTFKKQVQNAAMYAGALGKGKAFAAALSRQNPESYEDYLAFTKQTMPLLENRIKTLDQMGSTDAQKKTLADMFEKTANSLTSNPAQFVTQINQLTNTLNELAKSVQASANPLFKVNRLAGNKEIPMPNSNKNSTIMDMPRFSNKDEFRNWYANQPPEMQAKIRSQLGGK